MIDEQIYFVLAILETGQLIGDRIPNTTPLQKNQEWQEKSSSTEDLFFS